MKSSATLASLSAATVSPPPATEKAPGVSSVLAELGACKDAHLKPTLRVVCDERAENRVVFLALIAQGAANDEELQHFLCSAQIGGVEVKCP